MFIIYYNKIKIFLQINFIKKKSVRFRLLKDFDYISNTKSFEKMESLLVNNNETQISSDSVSSSSDSISPFETFLSEHTDRIIDVFYCLQEQFTVMNPLFLSKMKSTDLTNFIYDNIFNNQTTYNIEAHSRKHSRLFKKFNTMYTYEIDKSFFIFSSGFRKEFYIPLDNWILFCFFLSDLSEIKSII